MAFLLVTLYIPRVLFLLLIENENSNDALCPTENQLKSCRLTYTKNAETLRFLSPGPCLQGTLFSTLSHI